MSIQTLGPPPVRMPLMTARGDSLTISDTSLLGKWLNLLFTILLNVGPQLRASAMLDFPNTGSQSSSDLTIAVPGAVPGQPVQLAAPLPAAGCSFRADVTAQDVVTVRFLNASAAAVDPAAGEFSVVVQQ